MKQSQESNIYRKKDESVTKSIFNRQQQIMKSYSEYDLEKI